MGFEGWTGSQARAVGWPGDDCGVIWGSEVHVDSEPGRQDGLVGRGLESAQTTLRRGFGGCEFAKTGIEMHGGSHELLINAGHEAKGAITPITIMRPR